MCDKTSRSTLLACLLVSSSSVAAKVRHHLVACRPAASNRRKMLCRTTSHDSSVGLSLSRGLRQYFEVRLPIWPSVANAHPPRVVQRTQSVPRRGARPVLERMSAYACRHPHTRAVNRVGARMLRYLWRASEAGPIWSLGFFACLEEY